MTIMIAPSILNADFSRLGEEVTAIATADRVHVDIMDGHFVPNLSFGPDIAKTVDQLTDQHMEFHLMIEKPELWVERYIEAGADTVIFHAEATSDPVALAHDIHARGARAAFAVKPGTPIEPYLKDLSDFDQVLVMSVEPGFGGQSFMTDQLDKVRTLRTYIDENKLDVLVDIDGGVNLETIKLAAEAGVDVAVVGSAIYKSGDPEATIAQLREILA
ncbi:ribulose-phosphate 3-epimerase [Corynebacterium guangdongense]|uniref:Ribulose-phosphate 3-epimerase n=1 Tax=Corynebacterium guangdongense TaxID=1783348 RepID=A0ABU1ZWU4_9CORY|nr:ribulose-phosphate 3-epimerase [Corynebacterium guangdongense]MDR7329406.1 ribulose-phosphate 3-epimerase [Corynebacterium guangdongense]WJZ17971.1 Ribulose-phosphate 3-epimerase [Corynebacterium guangdongense]